MSYQGPSLKGLRGVVLIEFQDEMLQQIKQLLRSLEAVATVAAFKKVECLPGLKPQCVFKFSGFYPGAVPSPSTSVAPKSPSVPIPLPEKPASERYFRVFEEPACLGPAWMNDVLRGKLQQPP